MTNYFKGIMTLIFFFVSLMLFEVICHFDLSFDLKIVFIGVVQDFSNN